MCKAIPESSAQSRRMTIDITDRRRRISSLEKYWPGFKLKSLLAKANPQVSRAPRRRDRPRCQAEYNTSPPSTLATRGPFHLEATVRVLQRRPSNPVDVWEHGRYLRVLALPEGLSLVEVENHGTIAEPDVRFLIRGGSASSATRLAAGGVLRRILGLDVDPRPMQLLAEAQRAFCVTALALRGMRPPRFAGLFEAFASVVPFQQLSLEAGIAIVARMVTRFSQYLEYGGRRFYAFPTAQAIGEARLVALRACGLSARKAQTLRDLARMVQSGTLTEDQLTCLSTQEAFRTLTALPGIGPWSAGLMLLRGFGRTDVFPEGDVGAERGLRALMRRGPKAPLAGVIERFGEYRGYLYFYALGGWLLSKGLIHPGAGARMTASRRLRRHASDGVQRQRERLGIHFRRKA
ncbi:MAG TPA: AlkA N-terminal domain-containing protein [Steroidobacteraceae bacterium]|nr:AlkA N-terminal domain-containing protein [Steroidobacteraceae bacterium]